MKTYNHLWEQFISEDNFKLAYKNSIKRNENALISAVTESMTQFSNGRISFDVPFCGTMTFTPNDLTKLRNHFNGGNYAGAIAT